jgi:hypothetical protein
MWRERNDRNFVDRERTLGGNFILVLRNIVSMDGGVYLLSRLIIVTSLFVLLFLVRWFLLYTSYVFKGALRFP